MQRTRTTAVLAIAFVCCASDWARFRGPNGSGISADSNIPVTWTENNGRLWKTPISGVGNSSPIVCNGRVFLQSASADGKERSLICLNADDGKNLWTQRLSGSHGKAHRLNSLASATPAADAERVYAAFWDGREVSLHAFDVAGKPLWKRNLGSFASQHGPGTSPIVHGDKVFFANDQDGTSTLYAFDAKTGRTAWEAPRKAFRASYATPFILEREGGTPELIVASTAGITSYVPDTGKENWSWTWHFNGEPLRCVALPQFCDGFIFVSSGDGDGRRCAAAVKVGTSNAGSRLVWQTDKRSFPYVPSAVAWGKHLYYVTDKGFACCVSVETGEQVWMERLAGGDFFASPVLINGKVYAVSDTGTCYVFAAAPEFQLLGRSEVGERVKASPAVADGKLFIRGESHLFCIGK